METANSNQEAYNCVTCGNEFEGRYCNQCGEKRLTAKDRSILYFMGEFFHMLTHADSKFLKSLKYLILRPGFLTSEYLIGRRKLYTIPLSLFLIGNLLYFLLPTVDALNSSYKSQTLGQPYSQTALQVAEQKMQARNWTQPEMEERYNHESGKVSKMMLIVAVYMFSIPVSIIFFSRKNYYFDHLTFSLESFNFIIYFILLLLPWTLFGLYYAVKAVFKTADFPNINTDPFFFSLFLILLVYFSSATKRVYRQSWLVTIAKSLLLTFALGAVVVLYRWGLFYVVLSLL